MKEVWTRLRNQEVAKERIEPVKLEARQLNGATGNLGQLVFWGFNQQPSGYNGCGAALLVGLWVRPEPFHLRHNGAQRFRRDGHAIGMGYSSHSHGGLAGRQDPVVLRERSHNIHLEFSMRGASQGSSTVFSGRVREGYKSWLGFFGARSNLVSHKMWIGYPSTHKEDINMMNEDVVEEWLHN